ncbi:MAG: hypothetical protein WBZ08_24895 [Pseudolabrys sp.]
MPTVRLALLATVVAGGSIATGAYFAFRDDVFAGLVGRQTEKQITSEDQITALRAQVDRLTSQEFLDKERADRLTSQQSLDEERVDRVTSQQSLDKERVEQRIKPLLQRQATLEQVTSELAKDPSIQARYGSPASGAIESPPLLSPIEKPSAPIVAIPAESAKQAKQAVIGHKKAHRHHRKHARVVRKRTHRRPTIAAGGYNAYWGGPAGQQN